MLGAIAGDVIGSIYKHAPPKSTDFPLFHADCRFTGDTVLTIAVARAILGSGDYANPIQDLGRKYPDAGYSKPFLNWLENPDVQPENGWWNGAAMRTSPIGFAFPDVATTLLEAERCAVNAYNHPEGIKGAQAISLAIFLARTGESKFAIRAEITDRFDYDLNRSIDEIGPNYKFDVTSQGSVPEAIIAFLDSSDYEDAVRKAISLGGESDTLACMTGGIAHAFYKEIPAEIVKGVKARLPEEFLETIDQFDQAYGLFNETMNIAEKDVFQTLTFKLQVMGAESDCQTLWRILDNQEAQQYLSRQFQRTVKETMLRANVMIEEDFIFQLEMSENWHRPAIRTLSRDQNFFAAISRVNAKLRSQGQDEAADEFLAELETLESDRDAWELIGRYANNLNDD
ncbi:MAG: ADP-ribosylglycohydrolase family protein [Chloroflexota bacterium]